MESWLLTIMIFLPLLGIVGIVLVPRQHAARARHVALVASLVALLVTCLVVGVFAARAWGTGRIALEQSLQLMSLSQTQPDSPPVFQALYHVGIDGISLWLVALTALIAPLAIWGSYSYIQDRQRGYYSLMLLLQTAVMGVFCARDLLLFYIFFDLTLVPLFLLIGVWGGPDRRYAAFKFFLFTMAGSVLLLGGILYLGWRAYQTFGVFTFDLDRLYLLAPQLSWSEQRWLFLAMFAAFAVKVPLFPLHTWLPLAHTEAPTAGSVILAGLLLKLGTYGFLRFSVPLLPEAAVVFAPLLAGLAITGILYTALVAWVQEDFKKLIAYSSVSHLGFCMLGMFSLKTAGLNGSLLYMVNHGLSTSALFFVIGMIYERYHTRSMKDVAGLARKMPRLAFFMVFFALAGIGLPGLNGFVGEFLVLLGTFVSNTRYDGFPPGPLDFRYALVAALGIIFGAVYMFWWLRRVLFGRLVEPAPHDDSAPKGPPLPADINAREVSILAVLAAACLFLGVYPKPLIVSMDPAVRASVLEKVHARPHDQAQPHTVFVDATSLASPTPADPGLIVRRSAK